VGFPGSDAQAGAYSGAALAAPRLNAACTGATSRDGSRASRWTTGIGSTSSMWEPRSGGYGKPMTLRPPNLIFCRSETRSGPAWQWEASRWIRAGRHWHLCLSRP